MVNQILFELTGETTSYSPLSYIQPWWGGDYLHNIGICDRPPVILHSYYKLYPDGPWDYYIEHDEMLFDDFFEFFLDDPQTDRIPTDKSI